MWSVSRAASTSQSRTAPSRPAYQVNSASKVSRLLGVEDVGEDPQGAPQPPDRHPGLVHRGFGRPQRDIVAGDHLALRR